MKENFQATGKTGNAQDCPTCWGSTLGMLERLAEQQAAIAAVLMEGKVRHLMLKGEELSY